jgi:hypothetical protein
MYSTIHYTYTHTHSRTVTIKSRLWRVHAALSTV